MGGTTHVSDALTLMAARIKGFNKQGNRRHPIRKNPLHGAGRAHTGTRLPRNRALVARHGSEAIDLLAQTPALGLRTGFLQFGSQHPVAVGVTQSGQLANVHRCIQLQFRECCLFEHLAVQVQGLQLDDQTRFLFTPHAVTITQSVMGDELRYFRFKAGNAFTAENLETVKIANRGVTGLEQAGKQSQGFTNLRHRDFRQREKGNDLVIATENGPRCTTQGLNPFQLLGAIADMPDARAGHIATG